MEGFLIGGHLSFPGHQHRDDHMAHALLLFLLRRVSGPILLRMERKGKCSHPGVPCSFCAAYSSGCGRVFRCCLGSLSKSMAQAYTSSSIGFLLFSTNFQKSGEVHSFHPSQS